MADLFQENAPVPNELEWISSFLSLDKQLSGEDIDSVRNFSLLWNLFEGLVFNRKASVVKMKSVVSDMHVQGKLNIDDYSIFLNYFSNRYIKKGKTEDRFYGLYLRSGDMPELVESVLKGNEKAPEKILLALLIIVYRYRNNLFHGIKSMYDLPNQVENFKIANQLLMVFMEKWR